MATDPSVSADPGAGARWVGVDRRRDEKERTKRKKPSPGARFLLNLAALPSIRREAEAENQRPQTHKHVSSQHQSPKTGL